MKNRKLLLIVSLVLALTMSLGGTLAYLTDTDADVNTMTLGSVKIEQLEYERVVKDGKWVSTGAADKYGYTPDKLQPFTDDLQLVPAVFQAGSYKWDDRETSVAGGHQQSWAQVGASGSNQLFDDSMKNVHDKFVFVKNTGNSDAYVRTIIAFEQGAIEAENFENVIMTNVNKNHWAWGDNWLSDVEIDGNKYLVAIATYLGPKSNPTGILAKDIVSYPSLLQVYMKPEATNEDVEAIDGNKNGKYDIIVLSQAVQADGFANAEAALNAGFGAANAANEEDTTKTNVQVWLEAAGASLPVVANSAEEVKNALADGKTDIVLGAGAFAIPDEVAGKTVTFTGNGDDTVVDFTKAANVGGANITFENMKFTGKNANAMSGFGIQGTSGEIVYKNCTFVDAVTNEYYGKVTYEDCTFTGTYYIATYAVSEATFKNCTFDRTDSRAILVYSHGDDPLTVLVEDCTFKADAQGKTGSGDWTAAVEVDTTNIKTAGTTVTINNCTFDSNYNGIVRDKSAATATKAVITVDGVVFAN